MDKRLHKCIESERDETFEKKKQKDLKRASDTTQIFPDFQRNSEKDRKRR